MDTQPLNTGGSSFEPEPEPEPRRPRQRLGVAALLAAALAAGAVGGGAVGAAAGAAWIAPQTTPSVISNVQPIAQSAAAVNIAGPVYNAVGPAVVDVLVVGARSNGLTPTGGGTGFVVDESGLILTNNHVVAEAQSVAVRFSTGEEREAQVLGTDRGSDLALLRVDLPANTPIAPLGDSDLVEVGEPAIAIGSPFGLEATVTQGIVSAVARDWQPRGSTTQLNLIQTDTPINPGNSGGPLLNANGEVIGINTAIESPVRGSVGVGFAVPINTAKQLLPQLESGARIEPVWLGITGGALTPAIAEAEGLSVQRGVFVAGVVENGPAAEAQLQENDVITAIDGTAIDSIPELAEQLVGREPGDEVALTVVRDGQEQQVQVTLQARPQ